MRKQCRIQLVILVILGSAACTTSSGVGESTSIEPATPVVDVVPEEGCPEVVPDLTSVVDAKLERDGLHISVRTTTFCDRHEFKVHRCNDSAATTTYRVSEENDCEMPNDGVLEHILFVPREHLGEALEVETFDEDSVTIRD